MRKSLMAALALALVLLCMGAALAEVDVISGNLSAGGFLAALPDGTLAFAGEELTLLRANGARETVDANPAYNLQCVDGTLYFVSRTAVEGEDAYDEYLDTPYAMAPDGTLTRLGEPKRFGSDYEYPDGDIEYYRYTAYRGYADLCVYGGYIYYLGEDGIPGSYLTREANDDAGEAAQAGYETRYDTGAGVYRMKTDGSEATLLISGLGNGDAHLSLCNGRIAVASCLRNALYPYDFYDFRLYDLDGGLISELPNTLESRHSWLYEDDTEFTLIVSAIQTDGEQIFASLSDSEGDFASGHFVNVRNVEENLALEAGFARSIVTPDGFVYLGSDARTTGWDEVISKTLTLRLRSFKDGGERILASLPPEEESSRKQLALIDGWLYLRMDEALLRVPVAGGDVELYGEGGFRANAAYDPQNYEARSESARKAAVESAQASDGFLLPDSGYSRYSRAELEGYDAQTLGLMRNEILARHGYPFKKELYRSYFGEKYWYFEDPNFDYGMLNEIEMANIETIKAIEASR